MNSIIPYIFILFVIISKSFWANAQVAINETGNLPDSSAALDIQFSHKGVLLPRITTAQRDAITNPAHSLLIFNTTVHCYQGYNANIGIWENIYCFICNSYQDSLTVLPASNITTTSFTAHWTSVSQTYAYYIDVAFDSTFTNILPAYHNLSVGNTTSFNITNLTCDTVYYYRVRALGACGMIQPSNFIEVEISCENNPSCFTIGGANEDRIAGMTFNGTLYMVGWTNSFGAGAEDIYVIKIDTVTNIQWTKVIGGANYDYAYAVCSTTNQEIVLTGATGSFGVGNADAFVLKLDENGNVIWTKSIGGNNSDYARAIKPTNDGGFILAGYTNSFGSGGYDVLLVKINASGSIQWAKTVGGLSDEYAYSVIQTFDGGYITVGRTSSFGAGINDVYVTRWDINGNLIWTKTIGGTQNELAYSVLQTTDNSFLIVGWTSSFGSGSSDVYIIKINDSGNLIWTKTIGGANEEGASTIIQTSDGGYAIVGGTKSYGAGDNDIYLIKLDLNANVQWIKTLGANGPDGGASVIQLNNEHYFVTGITSSFGLGNYDAYIIKTTNQGDACCSASASGTISSGGVLNSGGIENIPSLIENTFNPDIKSGSIKKTQCP